MNDPAMSAASDHGPRISIVIPTYNSESHLAHTLDSVLAQTYLDWELVVYDDGSGDGTVAVAERYAREDLRVRVVRGQNGGVAAARNRGFAATNPGSEFVIFFDHDDLWEPDTLESLLGVLSEHPGYISAHSVCRCIDGSGNPIEGDDIQDRLRQREGFKGDSLKPLDPQEPTTFADLVHFNWVVTPGLHLVRRKVLQKVGGFDPATVPCDDWDMSVRLSRFGPIGYTDRALLLWRRHEGAQSLSGKWNRAYYNVLQKILTDPTNTKEQTRLARLAFVRSGREILGHSRELLAEGKYFGAVKQAVKAAQGYALYLRASLTLVLRRR